MARILTKKQASEELVRSDLGTPLSPASRSLGEQVLKSLYKVYPQVKQGWRITINERGGIVQVTNIFLSGKMGFILHASQVDPEGKAVMRAGGELLERYSVLRHPTLTLDEALKNTMFNRLGQMEHHK